MSSLEKLRSRKAIKMPSIESGHLQTIMFLEEDASIESDKQFNSSCKTNIQKTKAIVM